MMVVSGISKEFSFSKENPFGSFGSRTLLGSQGGEVEVWRLVDLLRCLNERLAHVCLFYFAPFLSWVVHWLGLGWMETYLNTLCGWIGLK
jgi:hypothetical protein